MKKTLILLLTGSCFLQTYAQPQQYTIQGKIGNLGKPAKLVLHIISGNTSFLDSVDLDNGNFRLTGTTQGIQSGTLYLDHSGTDRFSINENLDILPVILENGITTITSDKYIKDALVTGSPETSALIELNRRLEPLNKKLTSPWLNAVSEEKNALLNQQLVKNRDEILVQFITEHKHRVASIEALKKLERPTPRHTTLQPLFEKLSSEVRNTEDGKSFAKLLENMAATAIGATAPDIALPDSTGSIISLASLRGKYILVDFWANWCKPCREENPYLAKAYANWKNKNFEILGVAFENAQDRQLWTNAIAEDKITWPQVCDFTGWKSDVVKTYDIKFIPQNVLIGPDGKIIAKNLRGEKLLETLQKIFQ